MNEKINNKGTAQGTNKKDIKGFFTRKRIAILAGAVAAVTIISVVAWNIHEARELVRIASSHIDELTETTLEESETPLAAAPKVTTSTKTSSKTSSKKVSLSSAPKNSYTKTLPTKTSKSTKTVKQNNSTTVETTTTIKTETSEKYTKNVKQKVVNTKVTTTVVTKTTVAAAASANKSKDPYKLDTTKAASKLNSKVVNAYTTLGFVTTVNPTVSYAGYFNAKNKSITLREESDTIYHELGHFLSFIAGNYDVSSEFKQIYSAEKAKYAGYNKAYVNQNSSEYFAESLRDYVLTPSALKSARPKTYAAIEKAISKITDAQIRKYKIILSAI